MDEQHLDIRTVSIEETFVSPILVPVVGFIAVFQGPEDAFDRSVLTKAMSVVINKLSRPRLLDHLHTEPFQKWYNDLIPTPDIHDRITTYLPLLLDLHLPQRLAAQPDASLTN